MENTVYQTILQRRSIRQFTDQKVSRQQVDVMLRAAMAAPSACNLQPWTFIVVDDSQMLERLREAAPQGNYNAPLAIAVCGINKHVPWGGEDWRQDCGGAAQNIMLVCVEMGLASVCVGGYEEDKLRQALDIPDDVLPMCIIEIGYPAYQRQPLTWYCDEAVHYQRYDASKKRTLRTLQMLQDDVKSGKI